MPMDLLIPNGNGGYKASGEVAEIVASGLNVNQFRTNDTLQYEEWQALDTSVVQIARQRLVAVNDLVSRGLTMNLTNGLGTTVLAWQDVSDMTAADVSMEGITEGNRDRVTYDTNYLPLPIIHKDFYISRRVLEASRKLGQPLDTTQAEVATRLVSDEIEDILFNGESITFGGGTILGYRTHGDRNSFTIPAAWDASGTGGTDIIRDIIDMLQLAHGDNMFGPYVLYLPTSYWTKFQDDFKTNSDRTILERIRAIEGIADVKVADTLPANNVVLVQMSADVVKEVIGMQPRVVQWESQGGMRLHFKVMAIMVPRIASDHDGRSGIVHAST